MTKATSAYLNKPLRSLEDVGDKQMTHTPGPWGIDTAGKDGPNQHHSTGLFVNTRDGKMICDLYFDAGPALHKFDNDEANARLIAAAPNLLMVLEALTDDDECRLDHSGFCQTHTNEMNDGQCTMAVARAAIDKATEE